MNKKFLNDVKVLIIIIPGVVFFTFCLIASLMSADETAQYIISSVVWGGFDIFIYQGIKKGSLAKARLPIKI